MRMLSVLFFLSVSYAADTDIQFTGTVTNETCDLKVFVNGVQTNIINLGVVPPHSIDFAFDDDYIGMYAREFTLSPDMSQHGCQLLASKPTVTIAWNGGLDFNGLVNLTGTASDAISLLVGGSNDVGDAGNTHFITAGDNSAVYSGSLFSNGVQFISLLVSLNDTGTFEGRSSFSIVYN